MLRFLFLLLVLAPGAKAACETDTSAVSTQVDLSLTSYRNWEFEVFQAQHVPALAALVDALCTEIQTTSIAKIHLVFALDAAYNKDWEKASFFIRSVRIADPGFYPEDALIAEGSDLFKLFVEEVVTEVETSELPEGRWRVDGWAATRYPTQRATLVQSIHDDGSVDTWYVRERGVIPVALGGEPPAPQVETGELVVHARDPNGADVSLLVRVDGEKVGQSPWTGRVVVGEREVEVRKIRSTVLIVKDQTETLSIPVPRRRLSRTLVITSGALAVAAGAGFIMAASTKRTFVNGTPVTRIDSPGTRLKHWNHAGVIGGSIFAGGALGLGLSAVVVGQW